MIQLILIFFYSSAVIQIGYYLLVGWKIAGHNNPCANNPSVSIVVCTHNRLELLKILILKLLEQEYKNYEIIIVDDRSDDGTPEYLKTLATVYPIIRVVRVAGTPVGINAKKFALTQGIYAARNEVILLTDSDCQPNSKLWIKHMAGAINEGIVFALGYSPYRKESGTLNALIRFETLLTGINYLGLAILGLPYMAVGRNLAYRRSFFVKEGGLTPNQHITGGDDDLLVNRLATKNNTAVVLHREASVKSEPKKTWREFFTQKIRHLSVSKYYNTWSQCMLGIWGLSYFGFLVLAIILVFIGINPYIIIGVVALRYTALLVAFHVFSGKVGDRLNLFLIPFVELIYVIIFPILSIRAWSVKRVQWN